MYPVAIDVHTKPVKRLVTRSSGPYRKNALATKRITDGRAENQEIAE